MRPATSFARLKRLGLSQALVHLELIARRDVFRSMTSSRTIAGRTALVAVGALPFLFLLQGQVSAAELGDRARMVVLFMSSLLLGTLYIISPALGAASIREEKSSASLDLLRMTGMREGRIALAKALGLTVLVLLLAFGLLPLLGLGLVLGGVEPLQLVDLVLAVSSASFLGTSLGMFFASYTASTSAAYFRSLVSGVVFTGLLMWAGLALGEVLGLGSTARFLAVVLSPVTAPWTLMMLSTANTLPQASPLLLRALLFASPVLTGVILLRLTGTVLARIGAEPARTISGGLDRRRPQRIARRFRGHVSSSPVAWREISRAGLRRHSALPWAVLGVGLGIQGSIELLARVNFGRLLFPAWWDFEVFEMLAVLLANSFLLLVFAVALLDSPRSFMAERRRGTLELLGASPLSAHHIVFGKLAATMLWCLLLLAPWLLHMVVFDPDLHLDARMKMTGAGLLASATTVTLALYVGASASLAARTEATAMITTALFWVTIVFLAPIYFVADAGASAQLLMLPGSLLAAALVPFVVATGEIHSGYDSMEAWRGIALAACAVVLLHAWIAGPLLRKAILTGRKAN